MECNFEFIAAVAYSKSQACNLTRRMNTNTAVHRAGKGKHIVSMIFIG